MRIVKDVLHKFVNLWTICAINVLSSTPRQIKPVHMMFFEISGHSIKLPQANNVKTMQSLFP